jgi:hypothetical protein
MAKPTPKPDPSTISAFDRAMRGLVHVRKEELDAELSKPQKAKAKTTKRAR